MSAARLVPLLEDGEAALSQSLAIIEYLDETHPEPPLLPRDAAGRARVRALALDIACEIHPLNNLRVLRYLVRELKVERGGQERLVPALGRERPGGRRAPARGDARRHATATATRRRWPTARWCRRSSTRSASTAGLDHVPTVMRRVRRLHGAAGFRARAALGLPGLRAMNPMALPGADCGRASRRRLGALMSTRAGGVSWAPTPS